MASTLERTHFRGSKQRASQAASASEPVKEISAEELGGSNSKGAVLLDVREDHEWQGGHLPSAVHIPRGSLESLVRGAIPKLTTRVVCYCAAGYRSALAAETLRALGYKNVKSLAGGIQAWKGAGLPTVRPGS